MSNIEKIRAEIERMLDDRALYANLEQRTGGSIALARLHSFIDTLLVEPDNEEFTEEFDNYFLPRNREQKGRWGFADIFNLARHFANWQKEQMLKDGKISDQC